ncbi:L-glutamate ABC transporter membrane protein /L-aspartate ABC transporter membrane protein [Bosea sp. OK403]|uniref:amino acid ABC transporter permease n=1 Tax=Bosea sp. OK403 TaxID=1855286 RepID=UPI0008E7CAF5|nr:amino acid ABC transporter permease [Bosea sp. OK403]SFI14145.1 L-glutamate ABC transporter membrane protein /L-aspartate ABC transporter membrane protein [Bosea sp. OK403]
MTYRWNWSVLVTEPYLGWLLSGLTWTLLVAGTAWIVALLIGTGVGILRTLPSRTARALGTVYVEIFRNIPLLLQLFLWYFVIPELLPAEIGRWIKRDLPMPEFWTAALGLGLFTAARIAEQVRAGIEAVGRGQAMAAAASGLSTAQAYRHVLLPIAARNVLPPLTSEFLNIVKNSSLALTIGVLELTGQSRQIESNTFQGIEAFTAATLIYVLLTMLVIAAMRTVERATAIPGILARA